MCPGLRSWNSRSVMRLASEEIGEPTPPMLTPSKSGCHAFEKRENRMAVGTLLMT